MLNIDIINKSRQNLKNMSQQTSHNLNEIQNYALNLPFVEREKLVEFLILSLYPDEEVYGEDQIKEWERRADELKSGKVQGVPHEVIMENLRKKLMKK